jgi:hypothetical protein
LRKNSKAGISIYLVNFEKKELPPKSPSGKKEKSQEKPADIRVAELETKLEATRQEL